MTDGVASLRHPFRSPRLSGPEIGWIRPAVAIVVALLAPALLSMLILFIENPILSGPPKDGSAFTAKDHAEVFFACLAASIVVSWIAAPIALIVLRASALLGWAGWGSAALFAVIVGLPTVHFALNGDVTSEDQTILPHIIIAIAVLGLSVWLAFWSSIRLAQKSKVRLA